MLIGLIQMPLYMQIPPHTHTHTHTHIHTLTSSQESSTSGTDSDGDQKKKKKLLHFGTNVDLSDEDKWREQLKELEKLPNFLKVRG